MRHPLLERAPLALAQIGADIENQILLGQPAQGREPRQKIRRQRPGPRADLEDRAAPEPLEHLGALPREASAEQARDLRSRGEIAPGPELARARAVVAETRCVQRDFHVALEADPASRLSNLAEEPLAHPAHVLEFLLAEAGAARPGGCFTRHDRAAVYPLAGQSGIVPTHGGMQFLARRQSGPHHRGREARRRRDRPDDARRRCVRPDPLSILGACGRGARAGAQPRAVRHGRRAARGSA